MDLTPASEKSNLTPGGDGKIKKFLGLREWLNNGPATPKTPSPSFAPAKREAVHEAAVAITEQQSSYQTKTSSNASARITEDPTHPSATGISEISQHDHKEATSPKPRNLILESLNRVLEPESKTRGLMIKPEAIPTDSPQITEGLTGFEIQSQGSRASWNISEGLSDGDGQDEPKQEEIPEGAQISRTMAWLLQTSKPPAAIHSLAFQSAVDHYKKDIDTETGDFLPEIRYPDTFKSLHEGPSRDHRDIAWRQANLTVELQIAREIRSRELLATKIRSKIKPQVQAVPIEQETGPNAECIVRPATPEDFEAIAAIINMESRATGSPQIIEWRDVTAANVQKIYDSCRDNLQPFIVATTTEDPLLDRSNWPKNATKAYQGYLAFRSTQAKVSQEVLGFAFVVEARLGLLGGPCPGSRHTGQVKVVVHPAHRGKLYGSALLDRILLCTAPFHRRAVDYEWQCQDSSKVYESIACQNRRKYAWIYAETFCAGRDDPALKLATSFLQKFEFQEVCHLRSAVKTDRYYESKWLDIVLWARETQPLSNIEDLFPGAYNL
ncbi:hypothetical protein CFAM422_002890 [Trichoderma lentiforme]|uniref:Uncharacterized protein n=1 Tax=Trichoderma lentiforme TaxID=1567552 RepID=A0A9P5CHU4_9HYPO|nr:hypothetical protein CFAM422_002890 [Trichoderma lentiforme]